jgi:15-cis-phytoene synthase
VALEDGRLTMAEPKTARLTRESGTSFYYAFQLLPAEKRRAIYALYSFCRVVDDCVDEPGGEGEAGLERWREEVLRAYAGEAQTELGRELQRAVSRFPIPRGAFEDIVAGCRIDLTRTRYDTFADLRTYCEHVASAVGLASIEIFGYESPRTRDYAALLGLALQLTNILRDVAEDADKGRIYLPLDELRRFGVAPEEVLAAPRSGFSKSPALQALLAFQGERARACFEEAREALPEVDRRAMLPAEIMAAVYRALLEEMAARGWPVGRPAARLSRPRKAWLALRTVPRVYWNL